ncbi:MAG TPA: OmpA family protein [Nevskiaceae bacterium]|nr:OmpA family protein [Nevskiaceae bacterium]
MLTAATAMVAIPAYAQSPWAGSQAPSYDSRFYVAPGFTYTRTQKNRGTHNGLGAMLAIGKRVTPNLDLELLGTWTHYSVDHDRVAALGGDQPSSTRLIGYGAGFNLYAFTTLGSKITGWGAPHIGNFFNNFYLHLDAMHSTASGQPGPDGHSYSGTLFDGGAGFNVPLPLSFTRGWVVGSGTQLNIQALYRLDRHHPSSVGVTPSDNFDEMVYSVSLRIPLGANPADAQPATPPPAAAPKVVPVAQVAPTPPPPPPPACQPPEPGQPIDLEGCQAGQTLVLHGVNFQFNKATLTLNAQTILDQVAGALQARKDIDVEIDGYTDGIGSASYNLKLSQRRADSVKQFLVGRGVDAGRITTKGYGKAHPVASNTTEAGRAKNRRVELKILAGGSGAATAVLPATPTVASPPAPAAAKASAPAAAASAPSNPAPAAASSGAALH